MLKTAAPHLADLASGRPKILAAAELAPALRALADGGFEVWALDEGADGVGLVASPDGRGDTAAPVVAVASPPTGCFVVVLATVDAPAEAALAAWWRA
ncbi:MAG TPA: hypothetical protein VF606_05225, partial [Geminicoccaceae bacterium]